MFGIAARRITPVTRGTAASGSLPRQFGTFKPTKPRHYRAPQMPQQPATSSGQEKETGLARLAGNIEERGRTAPSQPMLRLPYFKADTALAPWELSLDDSAYEPRRRTVPMLGPSKKDAMHQDPFYLNGIDPLKEYENAQLLADYVSETGRIDGRARSNLTWRSQRKIGKAIRRAKAMGFMPIWSKPIAQETGRPLGNVVGLNR